MVNTMVSSCLYTTCSSRTHCLIMYSHTFTHSPWLHTVGLEILQYSWLKPDRVNIIREILLPSQFICTCTRPPWHMCMWHGNAAVVPRKVKSEEVYVQPVRRNRLPNTEGACQPYWPLLSYGPQTSMFGKRQLQSQLKEERSVPEDLQSSPHPRWSLLSLLSHVPRFDYSSRTSKLQLAHTVTNWKFHSHRTSTQI